MANVPEDAILNWTSLQETMSGTRKRAMRALMAEYTSLLKEPSEGFVVKVDDPFNWDVGIYGPPSTPYWGGYFKVHVTFPDEYPFEPPKLKFKSRFWHPNVYHNGAVCMSILHDPHAEEIPTDLPREEKWNPTLSVRTVLLSLISIMGSPNPDSPANPEASKMYRSWLEDDDQDYVKVIEDIVKRSKKTAVRDGVSIPKTLEEYVAKPKPKFIEPLVDYSSDSDGDSSSDQSELLSLPSSHGSDQETFFDAETSWNHDTQTSWNHDSQTSRTAFHNDAFPSLLSCNRSCFTPSSLNHEDPLCSHVVASPNETLTTVSRTGESCMSPQQTLNDNITSLSISVDGRSSYRESEQVSICRDEMLLESSGHSSLSVDTDHTSSPRDNDVILSTGVEMSSSSSSLNDDALTQSSRIVNVSRQPPCSRKRRRPPRLFLFSYQNDLKKRKKHSN